jgi:hypothetical protein
MEPVPASLLRWVARSGWTWSAGCWRTVEEERRLTTLSGTLLAAVSVLPSELETAFDLDSAAPTVRCLTAGDLVADALRGSERGLRARHVHHGHGPVRLGQVDFAALRFRPGPAYLGTGLARRRGHHIDEPPEARGNEAGKGRVLAGWGWSPAASSALAMSGPGPSNGSPPYPDPHRGAR